jgi:hypothetical protein
MRATPTRCIPIARSAPISRVRSRIAIQSVFMMPVTTMPIRITMSRTLRPWSAFIVHIMKDSSSSQVVTSSF